MKIFFKKNNIPYLLFLVVIIFIFLVLPKITLASFWGFMGNAISAVPATVIGAALGVVVLISNIAARIAGFLLAWVTGPDFINLSYTNPDNNNIIKAGLNITQNFVNLGLVVALIVIALSIALNLKEYASKKTLGRLIIIALLVNFAPVICGLIVDASNIVMNYFLIGIRKGVGSMLTGLDVKSTVHDIVNLFTGSLTAKTSILSRAVIMIILNLSIAFAFFLFAIIFFARYLVIWLLVILSPIAFVAWILPITKKKFWDMWWKQLVEWSIIGIPIAFFLYLGINSFAEANNIFHTKMSMPGMEDKTASLLNETLPYWVSILFLYLGFTFGIQTSATGASTIMDIVGKGKNKAQGWAKKGKSLTKKGAFLAASKAREKIVNSEAIRRWGEKQLTIGKWGEGEGGVKGWAKRAVSTVNPIRYARRGAGKALSTGVIESEQKRIKNAKEKFKDRRLIDKLEHFHHALTDNDKIGILNAMIENEQIDEAMDEKKLGKSAIQQPEIERLMKKAKRWESDKTLKRALPNIAIKLVTDSELEDAKKKDPRIDTKEKLIISKMKSDDYAKLPKSALDNSKIVEAILATATGSQMNNLISTHDQSVAKIIEDAIDNGVGINKKLRDYLINQAGRGLLSPNKPSSNWNIIP